MEHFRSASPYEDLIGFSRAVKVGDRIIVSGTAPIPQDGSPVLEGAFDQMMVAGGIALKAVEALGGSAKTVVRTRMYICDSEDVDEIGRAHKELFGEAMPAATMVVAQLLNPAWKVELEVEAFSANEPG